MAKIKSQDTKPELLVRRYLYSRGYRYRKNVKSLPGSPDIVLRKYGIAIFIHGCFWHGHIVDGHIPHTNSDFWKRKIEKNQERDRKNSEKLKALGWKVMTIWECQLKKKVRDKTLLEIEYLINKTFLDQYRSSSPKLYTEINIEHTPSIAAEGMEEYISTKKPE